MTTTWENNYSDMSNFEQFSIGQSGTISLSFDSNSEGSSMDDPSECRNAHR